MARSSDVARETGPVGPTDAPETDHEVNDRAADPLARAIYNLLRDRDRGDQRHVLFAVRGQFTSYASDRVTLCLNALNVCLSDRGRLSQAIYDEWRRGQPDPSEWPSSQFIRTTFDSSWSKAMDVAGQEVIGDVLTRRLLAHSRAFTRDEVIASICLYAKEGGSLTWPAYREWAAVQMQDPKRDLERVVRSMRPIQNHFGSWGKALVAAGLGEAAASRLIARQSDERQPQRRQRGVTGRRSDYSPTKLKRWLRTGAQELGCSGPELTMRRYDEWAGRHSAKLLASGRATAIPRSQTLCKMFGSWPQTLQECGLVAEHEVAALVVRRGKRRSDEELLDALAAATASRSAKLTTKEFDEWRLKKIREEDLVANPPPTSDSIRKRFGGWHAARRRADRRNRSSNQ